MMQENHSLKPLVGHKGAVLCCSVHGNSLVTAGHDRKIIVWDATNGVLQREIDAHDHIINSLDVKSSQNLREVLILSASWDKTVKVWRFYNGQLVSTFERHNNRVKCVKIVPHPIIPKRSPISQSAAAVDPDVSLAVSGDDDGHIYIWDIQSGQALLLLDEHARFVVALALYFDASLNTLCLVSASVDATIRLWDLSEVLQTTTNDIATFDVHTKVPTQSSICAIKTPSKYISSLVTATVSSTAPLITGTNTSNTNSHTTTATRATIPTATTSISTTTTSNDITSATETILIAADTLGSIYIYRALTGELLVRLETKCKIISIFTTHFALNSPCFPNERDMNGYYTGMSDTKRKNASGGDTQSQLITPERHELLLHYANMKRQHNIVNTLSHRNYYHDSIDKDVAKYLYYVPDNGSTGCFCLLPDTPTDAGDSRMDITSSIALTHSLNLSLYQSMDALYSGSTTRRAGSCGSVCENSAAIPRRNIQLRVDNMHMSSAGNYRNTHDDDNCSVESISSVAKKRLPLAHSMTEPNAGAVASYSMLKSSTVGAIDSHNDFGSDSVNVSGNVSLNNSGKMSVSNSGKVLQAFNSSASPANAKTRRVSTRTAALTNATAGGKKYLSNSSGGVMSVSINTPEAMDNILLQCFAMSGTANLHTSSNSNTDNTTRFMVFGGRDSVLFYCAYKPSAKSAAGNAESVAFTPARPLSLVIPKPAVISMTDVLTPYQSPVDLSKIHNAGSSGGSKNSGTSVHSTPSYHKSISPTQPLYSPNISDNLHSSPYKPPSIKKTSTSSANYANDYHSHDGDSIKRHGSSIFAEFGEQAATTTVADTQTLSNNSATNISAVTDSHMPAHSSRTLPELVDESLADLDDEMSLSEVSHIHHYYNDILSGRLTQRPDDDSVRSGAKTKTHLSAMMRTNSADDSGRSTTTEKSIVASEDYKGSMLEYLHVLDRQHNTNHTRPLDPAIKPSAKVPYYASNYRNTTNPTPLNQYDVTTSISSNSKPTLLVSGYASIVGSSSMDTGFWEAANTAKSKYSFGRIKLQSHNNTSTGASATGNIGSNGSVSGSSTQGKARGLQRLHPIGAIGAGAVGATSIVTGVSPTALSVHTGDPKLVHRAAELKKSMVSMNAHSEHVQPVHKMGSVRPSNGRKNGYDVSVHKNKQH